MGVPNGYFGFHILLPMSSCSFYMKGLAETIFDVSYLKRGISSTFYIFQFLPLRGRRFLPLPPSL